MVKTTLKPFQFRDRDGQTLLPDDWRQDLKPTIQTLVQTCGDLDQLEDTNITAGLLWLSMQKKIDITDPGFWLKFHKKLFCDVWRWAGAYKRRDHANPDFATKDQAPLKAAELAADIKHWILEGKGQIEDVELAAMFHERLLTIHPFQNGNGRTARLLTEVLCRQLGLKEPSWGESLRHTPQTRRTAYIAAIMAARGKRDYRELSAFMFF